MIESRKIYYLKLSGERVWVQGVSSDGKTITIKRLVHSHDEGDFYRVENWDADELQDETAHNAALEVERQAMARLLKANGITVLSDESPLHTMFHSHGEDN